MFVTHGSNTIEHADADCHCSSCKQLLKPDKIITLRSPIFRQRANFVNNAAHAKVEDINAIQGGGNVILLSAAIKSAAEARREKVKKARFNYPMLECS
jgi:hypothetical protein